MQCCSAPHPGRHAGHAGGRAGGLAAHGKGNYNWRRSPASQPGTPPGKGRGGGGGETWRVFQKHGRSPSSRVSGWGSVTAGSSPCPTRRRRRRRLRRRQRRRRGVVLAHRAAAPPPHVADTYNTTRTGIIVAFRHGALSVPIVLQRRRQTTHCVCAIRIMYE